MTVRETTDLEYCINDLKKFHRLPPYEGMHNFVNSEALFNKYLNDNYSSSVIEEARLIVRRGWNC